MIEILPVIPIDTNLLFPQVETDYEMGTEYQKKAFEHALTMDSEALFLGIKNNESDTTTLKNFYRVGTTGRVLNFIGDKTDRYLVSVKGNSRFEVHTLYENNGVLYAEGQKIGLGKIPSDSEVFKDIKAILDTFRHLPAMGKAMTQIKYLEKASRVTDNPEYFSNILSFALNTDSEFKQELLEMVNSHGRIRKILDYIRKHSTQYEIDFDIESKVKKNIEENQRKYYLNEKLKVIREELGDSGGKELDLLEEKIYKAEMSEEATQKALDELSRLRAMSSSSAEATVARTYIQWLIDIPWKKKTREKTDIVKAREILDRDHYGLEDCKDRIIEFLAVKKLTKSRKNPIICLVGPPGVGKTSIAKGVAEATGKNFARMSLGGVRDEAEIRGHRRTYIGSIPGRIVYMMKKTGTVNSLLLLDEIDKLSSDFRGDPSSALLELLDPEQNSTFVDHYIDVDYNLSQVFFIVTANVVDTIPGPLRDRLEIIRIPGYTFNEKFEIAKRHLIPKKINETGMKSFNPQLTDTAVETIIEKYTREAGVRNLEREIGKLFRRIAVDIVSSKDKPKNCVIDEHQVLRHLGIPRFKNSIAESSPMVGVSTGLAWTPTGGDVLFIEVIKMHGNENIQITGQLGEVMKESVKAAFSYIKANSERLGINPSKLEKTDIHVHIPEGAIPKDGPSAGVAVAGAIYSAICDIPVDNKIAMTGEITLRGRILPVGGIKEKLLAAHRAGIYEIILPEENEKDLKNIPEEIKNVMTFHFISQMDDALCILFNLKLINTQPLIDNSLNNNICKKGDEAQ